MSSARSLLLQGRARAARYVRGRGAKRARTNTVLRARVATRALAPNDAHAMRSWLDQFLERVRERRETAGLPAANRRCRDHLTEDLVGREGRGLVVCRELSLGEHDLDHQLACLGVVHEEEAEVAAHLLGGLGALNQTTSPAVEIFQC